MTQKNRRTGTNCGCGSVQTIQHFSESRNCRVQRTGRLVFNRKRHRCGGILGGGKLYAKKYPTSTRRTRVYCNDRYRNLTSVRQIIKFGTGRQTTRFHFFNNRVVR